MVLSTLSPPGHSFVMDRAQVAVIGGGVVGCAVALALARHGAAVALLEAEPEPGLAASGTNSGIFHTGFDSPPGELETKLILRSAELREPLLQALRVPMLRCGALLRPLEDSHADTIDGLAGNAHANGVETSRGPDGSLEVPGEAVTDPVVFTLALAAAARRHGAVLHTIFPVTRIHARERSLDLQGPRQAALRCQLAVNCAGLQAHQVARLVGDDSFEVYPRKGEFLVFEPAAAALDRILLPVPTARTKGVLVFPTLDGKVVAGPTAVDQDDAGDWAVRAAARAEILPKAIAIHPPLRHAEPVAAYAGLRPAGRGVNYLIEPSPACPRLLNVAAIRSTGLSACLGIAERVCRLAGDAGLALGPEAPLEPAAPPRLEGPWWRRTALHRAA